MRTLLPHKQLKLNLPNEFDGIVGIAALCDLRPNEIILFEHACELVGIQLRSEARALPNILTNIFFVGENAITLQFEPAQYGACFTGIYYPVYKWRAAHLTDQQIITCIIEEMCHVFWGIRDEIQVEYKVLDVVHVRYPELTLGDLYSPEWLQ